MYRFQFSSHPKCTLHEDFSRLLRNRLFCDIEFLVGQEGIVVPAHMAFVAARSTFLRERILRAKVFIFLLYTHLFFTLFLFRYIVTIHISYNKSYRCVYQYAYK